MRGVTLRARLVAVVAVLILMTVVDSTIYMVSLLSDGALAALAIFLILPLFKRQE